jgi:hypothetical protein
MGHGPVVGGFYDGAIWGTTCDDCGLRPGLYPPCPNPCQTTLIGEILCDVKTAVDGGLSHLFCCLFGVCGMPCGCVDNCTCGSVWDGYCDGASCDSGYVVQSGPQVIHQGTPMQSAPPATESQVNPFSDDPTPANPGTKVQPIPNPSARRPVISSPRVSHVPRTVRRTSVRPINYEQTAPAAAQAQPQTISADDVMAQPLRPAAAHYQPRRTLSLRSSHGGQLKAAPVRANGTLPSLRFREAN